MTTPQAPPLRILTFGGCGLNNAIGILARTRSVVPFFRQMGFQRTPYALSSTGAVQLLDFLTGAREIPEVVRRLCYVDAAHIPNEQQARLIDGVDAVMVEMSTPIEFVYEGFSLNANRFDEVIIDVLKAGDDTKKLSARWRSSLLRENEEMRAAAAEELLAVLPDDEEEQRWVRGFVRDTRSRRIDVEGMIGDLARVRDRIGRPMGMVLHNFQYMPDGRPISWPAEFKDQAVEVARVLGVPALDYAPFVTEHGAARVMAPDLRHWNADFYPQVSQHLLDFVRASVLGG